MFLIGLCGRSGSGKSTVCAFLKQKGVFCIDADKVCHDVYDTNMDCVNELCCRFGDDVMQDGKINRALLGQRAFSSENGVKDLNDIAHKYISAEIFSITKTAFANGYRYVVLDAPLLFEAGIDQKCSAVISVIASDSTLLRRLKQRDNADVKTLKKRLGAQKSNAFLVKNSTAVIINNGKLSSLRLNTFRAMLVVQLKLGMVLRKKGAKYALR